MTVRGLAVRRYCKWAQAQALASGRARQKAKGGQASREGIVCRGYSLGHEVPVLGGFGGNIDEMGAMP